MTIETKFKRGDRIMTNTCKWLNVDEIKIRVFPDPDNRNRELKLVEYRQTKPSESTWVPEFKIAGAVKAEEKTDET